jgi:mRNA-degrading endonuclease RelE of RelBE toxin-antitoxin system
MTKIEIEQTIAKETQELSMNALQEVLDFIHFMKMKEVQDAPEAHRASEQRIHDDLRALDTDSLVHLEEEFANYKLLYPFKEPG